MIMMVICSEKRECGVFFSTYERDVTRKYIMQASIVNKLLGL